jgi:hypothetical protein
MGFFWSPKREKGTKYCPLFKNILIWAYFVFNFVLILRMENYLSDKMLIEKVIAKKLIFLGLFISQTIFDQNFFGCILSPRQVCIFEISIQLQTLLYPH